MEEILKLYQELRGLFGETDLAEEFHQQLHRSIQEMIDQIPDGTRIALRPAGNDTLRLLDSYDFGGKNIVGIVNRRSRREDFCGYPIITTDTFSAEMCDYIIVSSFPYHQEIKQELEALHVPYIDLYDELEKRGIQLRNPYFCYETNIQLVVNYFHFRYLRSEAGPQRQTALRELLQIAVEYKDFTLISNIYRDCGGENGVFPLLKSVWRKSKQLLDCIQNKLKERKQNDLIMYWTDAIPYELLHYLPEMMELSKQGTFFQRTYTFAPHTNQAMRAMFCNMFPIDNFPQSIEKIHRKNSPLIQFMENKGYKVRFVGHFPEIAMGEEYLLEECSLPLSCNMVWWDGIMDLLQSPEPCFYVFYFLESHGPYYTPDLEETVNKASFYLTRTGKDVYLEAAYGYLDQRLLLFHSILGNRTQIFLSDHGIYFFDVNRWDEASVHPYCFVVGENIPKMTVTRFFHYNNFEKLIRWIVDPSHFSLDDVCADEALLQDFDYYNPFHIDRFLKANYAKGGIAYRGIVDYEHKYVINSLGEEFFYQMQEDGSEKLIPLEDPALRAELRGKAGTEFLDVDQYDQFRYTRKLYDYLKSNGETV